MNRERIVLLAVTVLLGLLGWRLFARDPARFSTHQATARELPATDLPPADPVLPLGGAGARRDPFVRPSAEQPLPLLRLPAPPLPELPALLPPPWPDPGPSGWSDHLYARPAQPVGALDEVLDPAAADGGLEAVPDPPAAAGAPAQSPDYADVYDSVRLGPLSVIWGRILNENRWDLEQGDTIVIQQVDPRNGRDAFAPQTFEHGQGSLKYESFALARTLRNRIEREFRAQRAQLGPARAEETRDYLRSLLGLGLLESVAFQRAEELAGDLVRRAPEDVLNWMALGEVWERSFALDRAFALYALLSGDASGGAIPALPAGLPAPSPRFQEHPAPRVRMAAVMRLLGRDDLTRSLLLDALRLDPRDPEAAVEMGLLDLAEGRADAAAARLAAARRSLPGGRLQASLRLGLALGRAQLGQRAWTAAAQTFEEVIAAAPPGDPALVEAHGGRASSYYLAGDFNSAAEAAAEAVQTAGAEPPLLYLRGISTAAAGGAAGEAVRDLRAAAAAAPLDAAPALCALSFWLDRLGRGAEAGDLLQQALELDPSLPYARWLAASRALRDGDLDAAESGLAALVRAWPDCAAALAAYGWMLSGSEQATRAEVALRSAEERAPASVAAGTADAAVWADLALRRGLNLMTLGRNADARASFDRAQNLDPGLTAARNAIAAALYAEGDLASATEEFSELQDFLREAPQDPQLLHAKQWQARIETHDDLRALRDAFDGRRLRPGYDTQSLARSGVEPRLEDGALVIRGTHREKGETRAFREVPALAFRSAACDVTVGAAHRGDAGVVLALRNRAAETWSFRVHRDREGALHWTTVRAGKPAFGPVGARVPPGQAFRVEFRLDREPAQPVLQVWVDGVNVFAEPVAQLRNPTGMATIGLSVETANALPVDASLDNLEIVFAQQE